MTKFKIGDKVEIVKRDVGVIADFKNPGFVDSVHADHNCDVFINVLDATGRLFIGAIESRFTAFVESKPPLKVGDKVRITGGEWHKVGDVGEILDFWGDSPKVKVGPIVLWIDREDAELVNDESVVPVAQAPGKHWIIAVQSKNGQPELSHRPFVHFTESDAVLETQRLANANPGNKFVMYSATYEAFAKPVEPDLKLRWL